MELERQENILIIGHQVSLVGVRPLTSLTSVLQGHSSMLVRMHREISHPGNIADGYSSVSDTRTSTICPMLIYRTSRSPCTPSSSSRPKPTDVTRKGTHDAVLVTPLADLPQIHPPNRCCGYSPTQARDSNASPIGSRHRTRILPGRSLSIPRAYIPRDNNTRFMCITMRSNKVVDN